MDKRFIIALVLIGVVFLFYDDYLRWLNPPPPVSESDTTSIDTSYYEQKHESKTSGKEHYLTAADGQSIEASESLEKEVVSIMGEQLPERFVTIETSKYRARFSTHGASLISYKMKPNGNYLKREEELLPHDNSAHPGFRFWTIEGPIESQKLDFKLDDDGETKGDITYRIEENQTKDVKFTALLGDGRTLSIVYSFHDGTYTFECGIAGEGLENLWVRDYVEAYWNGGLAFTEPDTSQDEYYSRAYVYFAGDEMEELKIKGKKDVVVGPLSGETRWGAVRTKYFMAALIPETANATGSWLESIHDSTYTGKHHPNLLGIGLRLPIRDGILATRLKLFLGPIDYDVLGNVDPSLRKTMDWGWSVIAPFSKAILWSLKKLGQWIPNYGICIIIFSILIKIIVWPLTRKSYQSMAAMQRLQPKIKEMREKYKNDPQRVQREMMKLYKEEKVNPMGGCLPVLLQMPLLYGLFIVFRATIQFRNASFILWIKDLSQPDIIFHLPMSLPLYGAHVALLPILMGVSTFFQSKSSMTDPNQKMMLYFMPIFMTLIFNSFPSGLTLYYTLFNVLTMIQQKLTPPPQAQVAVENK